MTKHENPFQVSQELATEWNEWLDETEGTNHSLMNQAAPPAPRTPPDHFVPSLPHVETPSQPNDASGHDVVSNVKQEPDSGHTSSSNIASGADSVPEVKQEPEIETAIDSNIASRIWRGIDMKKRPSSASSPVSKRRKAPLPEALQPPEPIFNSNPPRHVPFSERTRDPKAKVQQKLMGMIPSQNAKIKFAFQSSSATASASSGPIVAPMKQEVDASDSHGAYIDLTALYCPQGHKLKNAVVGKKIRVCDKCDTQLNLNAKHVECRHVIGICALRVPKRNNCKCARF